MLLLVLLLILPLYQKTGDPLSTIQFSLFGSLYITIPFIILNLIQQLSLEDGIPYTLALFIIIWTNDTFAYLSGMAFGKHKFFERISPKKTWEGFIGGLIMGVIAALVFNYFFPETGLMQWILFAILSSIASVYGDFVESLIKRKANMKDSGTMLPGHGGMLDRVDSILLASPVIYIYLFLINSI
jgi:phosphatidate cytidylyltransferase